MLDTTHPKAAHATKRLQEETVIWLTTVRPDGLPQSSPVWFLWDGHSFLIYSKPDNRKLKNIQANSKVSLNLDGNGQGGDIVIIEGTASLTPDEPPANLVPEYLEKYRAGIKRIGMNPDSFAQSYDTAFRVSPSRWRVW